MAVINAEFAIAPRLRYKRGRKPQLTVLRESLVEIKIIMNILLSNLDCNGVFLIIVRVLHLFNKVACETLFYAREITIRLIDKNSTMT